MNGELDYDDILHFPGEIVVEKSMISIWLLLYKQQIGLFFIIPDR